MRVKRTRFALFDLADGHRVDVAAVLRGELDVTPDAPDVYALALLTGQRERLSRAELDALLSVPAARWVEAESIGLAMSRGLAWRGLLVSDADDERLAELRRRDAELVANGWNLYAAGYHYMTQREGMDLRDDPDHAEWSPTGNAVMRRHVAEYGPAPPPFHAPAPDAPRVGLPHVTRDDGLYAALARRRTTRSFATGVDMRREDLAVVLRYVFGVHGTAESDLGVCIKRTSPSGGARHSIEAYPLVAGVAGVAPGLYHYDGREHALTLLAAQTSEQVRATATAFACGQEYLGSAHVSLILTSRFERSYWKYRRTDKAYAAILAEAGHLSQTLYLIAAELGLGAYVTLAINSRDIEREMGLDGCAEGVVAMLGCGPRSPEPSPLDLRFNGG